MLESQFCSFPAISLLVRVVVAQDIWWWWHRICGGGGEGYAVGDVKNKAKSAQLKLELGLSLAKILCIVVYLVKLKAQRIQIVEMRVKLRRFTPHFLPFKSITKKT
jgi:hypothetical protein